MAEAEQVLDRGMRALLVARAPLGPGGLPTAPLVLPVRYWFDDRAVWMTIATGSDVMAGLARDPACALYLPPAHHDADDNGRSGVLVIGQGRVFSTADPLGLALHAPAIAMAMGALAARNAGTIVRQVQEAIPAPSRLLPHQPAVLRVLVDDVRDVPPLQPEAGISPPMPSMVPADIRRILAGRRQVLVAAEDADRLVVVPATWGTGFVLAASQTGHLPAGAAATVALDVSGAHATGAGLAVHGSLTPAPALAAEGVTWWRGSRMHRADLPGKAGRAGAVILPD